MGAPANVAADQPRRLEHLDMLGRRRERHRERFGKLADGALAHGEFAEHLAPRRIAERVEDRVEPMRIMFNHVV